MTKEQQEEIIGATTYTIFRTGSRNKRHYQVDKMVMGVKLDTYWVQLNGRDEVYCDCPGFRRQGFAKIEHKHIKIAVDFSYRNEPANAIYKIEGTGAKAQIHFISGDKV